jgi:hypothetical protein
MKRIKAEMLAAIGEPIDRRNLALQPIDEAREKDAIEVCLSSLVCQGNIELEDADLGELA